VSWEPVATLIPHSSAPLATRISAPPLSSTAPVDLGPPGFAQMNMQDQETAVLDDLLFVFMGYEGQYIRFGDQYNPLEEKSRLAGPDFRISAGLDPSLRDLSSSMLKMATHYSAIDAFVEVQSKEDYGSVNHALCAAIRTLLKHYLILIAQLEMKVINDTSFTLHQMHISVMPTAQSLAQLYALAQELLKKNSLLEDDPDDSMDEFDADNIIERLREGGDLLPGSLSKKRCIGGNVLALLTQRLATYSGDPAARKLLEMLLREASRPYVTMLNEWLHHGGIKDPHSEFMIGERASIKRERMDEDYTDEYWEKRYYIRDKEIPPQLESVREKVLLAGKYLNVVRECGGVNISSKIDDTPRTFEDAKFLDNVSIAYAFANAELLNLLLTKNSLRSRLRSMKHYFFLDRAEFFLYFLELSNSELRKPHSSVNTGKLQSLLDLVMHQPGSIAVADPFKEDVKVKMNEVGLTQWLMKIVTVQGIDQDNPDSMVDNYKTPAPASTKEDERPIIGFDALELDYTIPFPLSLIVSRKTVLRYQLIFRYTLALRHLETLLVDCWQEHSKVKSWTNKSSDRRIESWKRRAWTLRARMLVFVQQMLFFATAEVIEPNWQKLMTKVDDAQTPDNSAEDTATGRPPKTKRTVDELMQDHLDMLDSCMKDLGLTQGKLLRIHAKLMQGCTMFAQYTANLTRSLYAADPDLASMPPLDKHAPQSRQVSTASSAEPDPGRIVRMEDTLKRYEEHFNRHLKILIDSLNYYAATETVVLLGLCARLTNAEVQKRDDFSI
jgi:gamma-tubulin complex component 2